MGVISITQRQERLGNINGAVQPHGVSSLDIGTVRHTTPGIVNRRYIPRTPDDSWAKIGGALGDLGKAAVAIGADMARRRDDEQVEKLCDLVMRQTDRADRNEEGVTDWNVDGRRHLQGQAKGCLLRTGDGTKDLAMDGAKVFQEIFDGTALSIEASDDVKRRAMERLADYTRGRFNRMLDIEAREGRRVGVERAESQHAAFVQSWKNGNREVLGDVFASAETVFDRKGLTGEARTSARQNLAVGLASDLVRSKIDNCDGVKEFSDLRRGIKDGAERFLPPEIVSFLPDRKLDGDNRKALLEAVDRSERIWKAGRDADEREARQAVDRSFTARELSLRDVPQELWAEHYEQMGRDEVLRNVDPKRAMAYMDTASEMRAAAAKAKERASADAEKARARARDEAVKANEEGLSRSFAVVELMKMDGSIPQDQADEAQAAIWRKFRTLSLGGGVSPSFMHSFGNRLSGQLSDQETNAMRKFYQAFGFKGDLSEKGEVPASVRKSDTTDYYAPRKEGDRHSDNYFRIPAADLFQYGDTLLRTLRALGPDMNREGVVEREISRLKTDWKKREYDANRAATVKSVMDMQREARARFETAQPEESR